MVELHLAQAGQRVRNVPVLRWWRRVEGEKKRGRRVAEGRWQAACWPRRSIHSRVRSRLSFKENEENEILITSMNLVFLLHYMI